MRANGVTNFPDPQLGSVHDTLIITPAVSNAPQFGAALRACNHLLPNGGVSQETAQQGLTQLADWLSFARCMRSHGAARFPDPTAQGQLTVEMVEAQGIDVHSPVFLRGLQSCLPASHGLLTAAAVANAIKNAGR
jgi:hypothetical protein